MDNKHTSFVEKSMGHKNIKSIGKLLSTGASRGSMQRTLEMSMLVDKSGDLITV